MWEVEVGRLRSKAGLGKKETLLEKIYKAKRAGGVAQVVECLLAQGHEFKLQGFKKRKKV
jgi:hypothetical protein